MKASEVLIKNEKGRNQISGILYDGNGYCALGALACEAGIFYVGTRYTLTPMEQRQLSTMYGIEYHTECAFSCPRCNITNYNPLDFIPHLNDKHGMTFAEIGEWIKQFEK